MDKLLEMLKGIRTDVDFENETALVDRNILDSFDIITIVGELGKTLDITVKAGDIIPENFNSLADMEALVKKYTES